MYIYLHFLHEFFFMYFYDYHIILTEVLLVLISPKSHKNRMEIHDFIALSCSSLLILKSGDSCIDIQIKKAFIQADSKRNFLHDHV